MDKDQILSFIKTQIVEGKISNNDLLTIAGKSGSTTQSVEQKVSNGSVLVNESPKNITRIFYYIGAIIAVIGVIILIFQNWNEIGVAGRILVTLGISVVTYVAAYFTKNQSALAQVMFTISAALAPLGAYVLLDAGNIRFDLSSQLMTAVVLIVIFGLALYITKRNILVLLTVGFFSWAYYTGIIKAFDINYIDIDILKWATIVLGVGYTLIAYGYNSAWLDQSSDKEIKAVKNILYGLGTLGILGGGISLGGIFDLVFIALIFAAFYASVYVRSRLVLILAALFLMAHIIKLTSKYFADSVGWPVALIFVGFLVIGVGYATFYLNRKFISGK